MPARNHATEQALSTVRVSVNIAAEQETVWRFLSDPDKFLAWMSFIPGAPPVPGSSFEPAVGGAFRVVFPKGSAAVGTVVEMNEPRRLVFTWGYDPDVSKTGLAPGSCRVEISLVRTDAGTRVELVHSGPMSGEVAKGHETGWKHMLSTLSRLGADAQHAPRLDGVLADYFAAWNEPDDARRLAILARCCDPAVKVRTQFACTDTPGELSAHIANGLKHMPGMSLGRNGTAQHLHGFARVPWAVTGPNGVAVFAGENFVRLSPEGRLAEVVGFPMGG